MNREQEIKALDDYTRLTNYLSAAQIFLKDNYFIDRDLEFSDIKENLLGHWGTCPGINFVYAHVNRLITKHEERDFMITVGPGHGFPAFQSNLFVDGSLSAVSGDTIPYARAGAEEIIGKFSVPYGHPSHLNPEAPGVILEGGELGYSLSVAAGSVLDNPKLINTCIVGDGEAETGTIASSWHVNKFISPETDGAVLPVLHLNGYKISGPTLLSRMSNDDLDKYFSGLGYDVHFIDVQTTMEFHEVAIDVFDGAYQRIRNIQEEARSGDREQSVPKWPLIVMRTPKGLSGTEQVGDKKIVGNNYSHQIVFDNLHESEEELNQLNDWLHSYNIHDLISFEEDGSVKFTEPIKSFIPESGRAAGMAGYAHGDKTKEAVLPKFEDIYVDQELVRESGANAMAEAGDYMRQVIEMGNEFRLFSPDETYSNKLGDIFKATKRVWQLPLEDHDIDFGQSGRVIEMLSENVLFGMLWGYTVTGRYGYFVTYEAFAQIVASMADQYVKFIKVARRVPFRKPVPSMNIILSSLLERQDHNGFSHQNPSFIATNLDRDRDISSVYTPADKNLMKLAMEKTMKSYDSINVIVCGKKMNRTWLSMEDAKRQAEQGLMTWNKFSNDDPDVVVVTAGDYVTEEAIAGMKLIREKMPKLKVRFVNVFTLDVFNEMHAYYSKEEILDKFLTRDKGVVFNFHGYPESIKKLLFEYQIADRIIINGYQESGSTTSPFDMKARNGLSRFHLLRDVAQMAHMKGSLDSETNEMMASFAEEKLAWERDYIRENRIDPESIKNWDSE